MIGVVLEGRLGNQLFQYAFIYAAAKKLNTSFYIDKRLHNFLVPQYFEIDPEKLSIVDTSIFAITGFRNIFNYHLKRIFYLFWQKLWRLEEIAFLSDSPPEIELAKLQNTQLYSGYFQSEEYFKQYATAILQQYKVKKKFRGIFRTLFQSLPIHKTIVVVHIRKGDYLDLGLNLPMAYYHRCIAMLDCENPYYVFISDSPDTITSEFDYLKEKYISKNSEIIDLQFLINADVCILSNSSFSWWGAYLNKNDVKIFVPDRWLNAGSDREYDFPHSIICKHWIKVEC